EAFINGRVRKKFSSGLRLSTSTNTPRATEVTANPTGVPAAPCAAPVSTWSLTAAHARIIVNQFSQAKFPEATSHSWVTTTATAAQVATGCGATNKNGTP